MIHNFSYALSVKSFNNACFFLFISLLLIYTTAINITNIDTGIITYMMLKLCVGFTDGLDGPKTINKIILMIIFFPPDKRFCEKRQILQIYLFLYKH